MARRSTVRRVDEVVLFDVLYEDGTRTSNRKVPGAELDDIDGDLLAKTYIEAQDRQIAQISRKPRVPIKSLTRVRRRQGPPGRCSTPAPGKPAIRGKSTSARTTPSQQSKVF